MWRLEYYFLISFTFIISLLPRCLHYMNARIIAFLLNYIVRYRYTTILTNISRSFPEKKYKEIRDLAGEYYQYIADTVVETLINIRLSKKEVKRRFKYTNLELLYETYQQNKNVIVDTGHQGNWEIFSGLDQPELEKKYGIKIRHFNTIYVYKKMNTKAFTNFMTKIREAHSFCIMKESKAIVRFLISRKNEGGIYMFMADQCSHNNDAIQTIFLNQKTTMLSGPEFLATKLDTAVLFMDIQRVKRGYYEITFSPICIHGKETKKGEITTKYAELLEKSIIKNPATWLWSHRRWK
ncbi:MAG: lysophospholipid acyltransferase family protein [Bacteroidales bacterium]